jgi:hypothetical protein
MSKYNISEYSLISFTKLGSLVFLKISALLKISIELMLKFAMCGCVLGANFHENAIK